jgi:hypothetical protein
MTNIMKGFNNNAFGGVNMFGNPVFGGGYAAKTQPRK